MLFLGLAALLIVLACIVPPIPQSASYHQFADQRRLWGIPNFGNVSSNLPFAVVGIWGLLFLASGRSRSAFVHRGERIPYVWLFIGLLLTALGSAYYHLAPDNGRLVWDRLPMTIVFMSLVSALIVERVDDRLGLRLLPVLLALGVFSVVQWYYSEIRGAGDLRLYAAVQLGSVLLLLLALALRSRYTRSSDLGVVAGLYIAAKMFEMWDGDIFNTSHVVSGHTLKHLAAAGAGFWILRMLMRREPAIRPGVEAASAPFS